MRLLLTGCFVLGARLLLATPDLSVAKYYMQAQLIQGPAYLYQVCRMEAFQHPCPSWFHCGIVRILREHDILL